MELADCTTELEVVADPEQAPGEAEGCCLVGMPRDLPPPAVAVENALLYRQVEERAQASRVLAAVGDGVLLVDGRGVVRLWNPAAEAITGLHVGDVVGRPAVEAIPGWSDLSARLRLTTEVGATRIETVPLEVAGREVWLSISGVGFADGTVYAFRDLTQDRVLEELKAEFVGDRLARAAHSAVRRSTGRR